MTQMIPCSKTFPPLALKYQVGKMKIRLHPWDVVDSEKLQDVIQKNRAALCRFMPWIHYPMNFENLIAWTAKARFDYFSGVGFSFAICDEITSEIIGSIALHPLGNLRNPCGMEIGYWMDADYRNKGIITATTRAIVALGFTCFGCDRIQISCNKENAASRRVIEKCGFHFEGEIRNMFPQATEKMLECGFVEERRELLYALIPEDIEKLDWYASIVASIEVETLFGRCVPLKSY